MKPGIDNAIGPQVRRERNNHQLLMAALFVLVILFSLTAATQYFAYQFQYHAALGAHLSYLYAPWKILIWAGKWWNYYSAQFTSAGSAGIMVASVGLLLLLALKSRLSQSGSSHPYLHGSARWAERKDIETAGLIPRKYSLLDRLRGKEAQVFAGVYVGAWVDKRGKTHYLRHSGPEHILCYMRPPVRVRAWA